MREKRITSAFSDAFILPRPGLMACRGGSQWGGRRRGGEGEGARGNVNGRGETYYVADTGSRKMRSAKFTSYSRDYRFAGIASRFTAIRYLQIVKHREKLAAYEALLPPSPSLPPRFRQTQSR